MDNYHLLAEVLWAFLKLCNILIEDYAELDCLKGQASLLSICVIIQCSFKVSSLKTFYLHGRIISDLIESL